MYQNTTDKKIDERDMAFMSLSMPCNPLPFLHRIIEIIKEQGTDGIKSLEARSNLWLIMARSYSSLWENNMTGQWQILRKEWKEKGVNVDALP